MSDHIKTLKQLSKSEELNYYQTQAKSYSKCYNLLIEGKMDLKSNPNFQDNNSGNNIFSNSNNFNGEIVKEKVLKWFFSLPLESRIKIATVENSFMVNSIHQMYQRYRGDTKVVFQSKQEYTEENSNSNNKANEKYGFRLASDANQYTDEECCNANLLNFYNYKSNRTETQDSMIQNIWMHDVRLYTLNSELDSLTVAPRVLKDQSQFYYYFKYVGHPRCFYSLIKPQFDTKHKIQSYSMPDWFDQKEFFSVGQFVAAYIEQAILIKFVLNLNRKDKPIFSLYNEKKMNEFFQRRKEVLGCLNKHFNNENKTDLFNYISPRRMYNDTVYDKSLDKIKKLKNRTYDGGYVSLVNKRFTEGKNSKLIANNDIDFEEKMISKYKNEHYIFFVDSSLYFDLDIVWNDQYFISIKLFEDLHCLYTDKNYEELINDMVESQESKKNTQKKGKKNIGNIKANTKKKNLGLVKSDSSSDITEDPDFDYYSTYLLDTKNHSNVIRIEPKHSDEPIENKLDTLNLNESNKNVLYDSYTTGQKNIIIDFIKNYIVKDFIDSAVEQGNTNIILKTASCKELLDDICKISSKSKMINNYLNNKTVEENNLNEVVEENNYSLCSDKQDECIIKLGINEPVSKNSNSNLNSDNLNNNNNNHDNSNKLNQENINNNNEDLVNYLVPSSSNTENNSINNDEVQINENKEMVEETNTINNSNKTNQKKKKKEPSFFLYDTTKKRKEKTNNTVNTNNNKSSITSKDAINNINSNAYTNNSNTNNTIPITPTTSTTTTNTTNNSNYYSTNTSNKIKSSPNNNKVLPSNSSDYYNTYYKTNQKQYNTNYNQHETNHHQHSSENREDTRSSRHYRINNNSNKGYYRRERERPKDFIPTDIDGTSNMTNNYYIFNSVTHVTSQTNPMMMYQNPTMMPVYNSYSNITNQSSNSNMRNLMSNINLNKYSNDFLTFVYKLHNDIVTYHRNVTDTLESMKEIKIFVTQFIEKLIKANMSDDFSIDIYGSFASDLSIESSDIDIKIRLKSQDEDLFYNQFDPEATIMLLVKKFISLDLFESVIPIYTASVPIIKIVVDPSKVADDDNLMRLEEFKNSEGYKNYKFDKEEINKIKIDLTFIDIIEKINLNNGMNFNNGTNYNNLMSSVEFAKDKLILYPEIKPLLQMLKRLLQIRKMNSCFNGGLSSFCLFLLILAFIKFKLISGPQINQNNLGRLLLDFLEFYGRMYNFHGCTVDVNLPNPFIINNDIYDKSPIILDPLSYNNASKSSYRIDEVKESFADALDYLNLLKIKYDKIDNTMNMSNIVYDLLSKK